MRHRLDKRNRWRVGMPSGGSVNLISMMDILTVLLLFLLKSYVAGEEMEIGPLAARLQSVAQQQDEILVGNEHVTTIQEALRGNDLEISPLATRLQAARQQQEEVARLRGETGATTRAATIQGDRNIEFRVLQRVMYTLNRNGYENVALAVIQKS